MKTCSKLETTKSVDFLTHGANDDEDFVVSDKLAHSLLLMDSLVGKNIPVLIQGPICCGKTALISLYAKIEGRQDSVRFTRLQLHDQMDGKSLIGTYVVGEEPGQFVWQPGPLTEAVRNGYWLLLEDLDAASSDALACIVQLAEFKTIRLPNRKQPIKPHPDFRLFATLRTSKHGHFEVLKQALINNHSWSVIELEKPDEEHVKQIIHKIIPSQIFGEEFSKKLLDIADSVSSHWSVAKTGLGSDISSPSLSKLAGRKQMTLRDFIKFVKRIEKIVKRGTQDLAHPIWLEAVDTFTSHMPDRNEKFELCSKLGVLFSMARETVELFLNTHRAEVRNEPQNRQFLVGRSVLPYFPTFDHLNFHLTGVTSYTRHFANLLEIVCSSAIQAEPVLLVGETGCGKTYLVQHLARMTGHNLSVANMSQQTDATDLLGGYRPVDFKIQFQPLKNRFEDLFAETFSVSANGTFLSHLQSAFSNRQWNTFSGLIERVVENALNSQKNTKQWTNFQHDFKEQVEKQRLLTANGSLPFTFVEGLLVKAVREGLWLLLDEINLAPQETLDSLAGLMEGSRSLTLYERGTLEVVPVHSDFRLFACMNPATDVGKKPLPESLRARFTEVFVPDPTDIADLRTMIQDYLSPLGKSPFITAELVDRLAHFYINIKKVASEGNLLDGSGGIPHFSIRTLCRGLSLAAKDPLGNHLRSIAECLLLSFLTQLNNESLIWVHKEILLAVYGAQERADKEFTKIPTKFKIPHGNSKTKKERNDFIITNTVSKNIEMLSRVVALRYDVSKYL